jgi:hypothetical protein
VRKKRRIERKHKKIETLRGTAVKRERRRSHNATSSEEEDSSLYENSIN